MESTLTPQDLALLLKAQNAVVQAQQLSAFVSGHLSEVYKLSKEDQINMASGEITRHVGESI